MSNAGEVTVVIVPFPVQGHLNQLLHLSLLLSTRSGLAVHFASLASHNRQAKLRLQLQGWPLSSLSSVHFHDLPLPPIPSPPPNPHSPNSFPTHLQPLFDATDLLRSPLSSLLHSLSATTRRLVVVHDHLMSFAGLEAAAIPNAESYKFYGLSVAFLGEVEQLRMKGTDLDELFSPEFRLFTERRRKDEFQSSGLIINTCRLVERNYLKILARTEAYSCVPVFVIGPLNPLPRHDRPNTTRDECLEWLDRHPPCSVVYISFGSTIISDEQVEQLASGLLRSGHRFFWVLLYESSSRLLSAGFLKAVEGVGKVVRGWVPQLDILAHPATGGFMSHCGWNSCMEAVSCGVPVMAWPMHSDQPANARLLAEGLMVGLVVRGWDRRREVVAAERVEEVVRMVMEGEKGSWMRENARRISEALRATRNDGGSSKEALDLLVGHWRR
ncbi:cis-zeatin O-glucosyltransferase 1 [Dendrobium catenatum]|uniref:Glycosyltransferase n=1 Tax=Dendrobium catenatum TaxID=906689 RepID=A0A2I0WBG8_9ASPA|nr:cis-zeatin O-glucosyltransferase 1 [Dendrobium catenatum]PKU73003.1 Zeatin O-glucosyltransferase [Dendrobium catenatum]